jgi:hypothetical protein
MACLATLSQAATVSLSNWAFNSQGNVVSVSSANNPLASLNGPAGAVSGTLSFNGTENGFGGTIANFVTYSVELTQALVLPTGTLTDYSVLSAGSYGEWTNANGNGKSAAQTGARLGQLLSYVDSKNLDQTAAQSTALQLAIWNIVYDNDNSVTSGIFQEQSGASYDRLANLLLTTSQNWGRAYDVFVLSSNTSTDFLLTSSTDHPLGGSSVPEPTSAALVLAALAAAAFGGSAARRRRG